MSAREGVADARVRLCGRGCVDGDISAAVTEEGIVSERRMLLHALVVHGPGQPHPGEPSKEHESA